MIHEISRRGEARVPGGQLRGAARHAVRIGDVRLREKARSPARTTQAGTLGDGQQGTLFLDEIADLSLIAQASSSVSSRSGGSSAFGGNKAISVDFRRSRPPTGRSSSSSRRALPRGLYYRVNAFAIRLPSLRERQVDIRCPVAVPHLYCAAQGMPLDSKVFSPESIDLLVGYQWPGNIRELESTVSRAALSAPGRTIRAADIEFLHATTPGRPRPGDRLPRWPTPSARTSCACWRRRVEQERSRAGARHQPGHPLPEDRRIQPRARAPAAPAAARPGGRARDRLPVITPFATHWRPGVSSFSRSAPRRVPVARPVCLGGHEEPPRSRRGCASEPAGRRRGRLARGSCPMPSTTRSCSSPSCCSPRSPRR